MATEEQATAYIEVTEGRRVVQTSTGGKFIITKDTNGTMWTISVSSGPLPSPLRGKYTHHDQALVDIKNYVDGHGRRQIEYKKLREKAA